MAINQKTRQQIRSALRKIWMFSQARRDKLKESRVRHGIYQCELCGSLVAKSDIQIDHVVECGRTPGARGSSELDTWDGLINRMFDDNAELQSLCRICHDSKTHS